MYPWRLQRFSAQRYTQRYICPNDVYNNPKIYFRKTRALFVFSAGASACGLAGGSRRRSPHDSSPRAFHMKAKPSLCYLHAHPHTHTNTHVVDPQHGKKYIHSLFMQKWGTSVIKTNRVSHSRPTALAGARRVQ